MKYVVLLFYKYVPIDNPQEFRDKILGRAGELGLTGRILVANEGINGTVEGEAFAIKEFEKFLLSESFLSDMDIKRSEGTGDAFKKLKVKVRDEIVGTKFPKDIDPTKETGKRLSIDELRNWYEKDDEFVVIDMRNDYEFMSGHFKNSVNPGMNASRELPQKIEMLSEHKGKKVLTVCTGGIRCEKMSAYLMKEGFEDVYQLEGGMHTYMEKYPGKDFLGTLFTFDNRLTMDFGGEREVVGVCFGCEGRTERYGVCSLQNCNKKHLYCDTCESKEKLFCDELCKEKFYSLVSKKV